MSDFPFDIVGFDLDGTLFDTSPDLADAVNHALGLVMRPPLGIDAVKAMIGRGPRVMMETALEASGGMDREESDRLYQALLLYYEANVARGTRGFPGMIEALNMLAARGVRLAIVTNKPEYLAAKLVRELGLAERFDCVIGGDTMGPGNAKPSALPILEMIARCGGGRAAFVGDSIYDIVAAKNAGIASIAVDFGFVPHPVEELGADAMIAHFDELLPVLEKLGRVTALQAADT